MTTQKTNPFVMPGRGQDADMANNPLMASMEMMRQAWESLSGPGGLAQAVPVTAVMSLSDLERRVTELRSVESWLRMNLSMLSSTIQGLEVQRSTIATLRAFADSMPAAGAAQGGAQGADEAGAFAEGAQAAQSAAQAWWGQLQNQFNQLAAATAATMPAAGAVPGAKPAGAGKPARKSSPKKSAARRPTT